MAIEFLPPPKAAEPEASTDVVYRELTPEEIKSVEHIFVAQNAVMPDPKTSTFIGAVLAGEVIGFLVLQLKLHAEPMWIQPGYASIFQALVAETEKTILRRCGPQWVYLFAPAGRVSQLAQNMGLQLEPWNVLSKLVMPDAPPKAVTLMEEFPPDQFEETPEEPVTIQ